MFFCLKTVSKFCGFLCFLCATFLTERDIFFSRKGAKFRKVCVLLRSLRGVVSHRIHGTHRIPAEKNCLTQTAQSFAETCRAKFCGFL